MKKQIIIFLLFTIHFSSGGQNTIKTSTPCNDEIVFRTPGRWLKQYNGLLDNSESLNLTGTQKSAIITRLDAVHRLMLNIYPHPMAIDAAWHHSIGYGTFGEQVKYERNSQGILNQLAVKEKPVAAFDYTCGFFRYSCVYNRTNEMLPGYPGETPTWLWIYANNLQQATVRAFHGDDEEPITVNGYPVYLISMPVIKQMGDFELRGLDNETDRLMIIHRPGMLPYIPVTRKQYLENCISTLSNMYDKGINSLKEAPLPYDDKDNREMRAANIEKSIRNRETTLQRYRDELEKTTNEGLLDAPAIVQFYCSLLLNDQEKIFLDEREGSLEVIENADYMRKDLPKYVPQFFVVKWRWEAWKGTADLAKLIEENFPFEKLQEMIDK